MTRCPSRLDLMTDLVDALAVQVQTQAEQFEAERRERDAAYERRLLALERRLAQPSTTFEIQPRLTFDRGNT
jgi:hypothetical protein